MQIVEIFSVDQQVHHVIPLSADLESGLYPINFGVLEKLRALKSFEKTLFRLRLRFFMVKTVENPALNKLLIAHSHLNRVGLGTSFLKPV